MFLPGFTVLLASPGHHSFLIVDGLPGVAGVDVSGLEVIQEGVIATVWIQVASSYSPSFLFGGWEENKAALE